MENLQTVVIDNGTGFTKMGYAGNPEPTYMIPTCIADHVDRKDKLAVQVSKLSNDQLDFYIGYEALQKRDSASHQLVYPMAEGIVQDWEYIEKIWHRSIFDYLRCEPEQTVFVLTEPPLNPPKNREKIAEIMFETFNVKGLYIGVQAVLALISNSYSKESSQGLSGTVLDSGDGVTHIIPISDGYVIGSQIKHMPLAGRDMTKFIMQMLKDRKEPIDNLDLKAVASEIKEQYCYVCPDGDIVKEYEKFDVKSVNKKDGSITQKRFKEYNYKGKKIDIGYEQFLAPEMFFHPEIIDGKWKTPIDEAIDNSIQSCPIDSRRKLYNNVVLSGGSTLFKNFSERLQLALQTRVDNRLKIYEQKSGHKPADIKVNVEQNPYQKFSVWQGGSLLATDPKFEKAYHKRETYLEEGPKICRFNAAFSLS